MKYIYFLCISTILSIGNIYSQQTVGLFINTKEAYKGYSLFAPTNSKETYLINNCGEKVHSWSSTYLPGMSSYLLEDGTLVRTARGGFVEMINWDGVVIWSHTVLTTHGRRHHDIEILPNGNILLLVHDEKNQADIVKAGGITSGTSLTSEQIVEIQPDLINGGATVVWEWKAWDHLIQDIDSLKDNFGIISANPQRIDINYLDLNTTDWLHFNGIDYNEEFDQIIVSGLKFSEFWIIDHSTSTAQAADSKGGRYGKGGDLLYRWGNPQAYGQGTISDQKLFQQHNAHWIDGSMTDAGKILVFNNQAGNSVGQNYSTVNIVQPKVDSKGFYFYQGGAFEPTNFDWTYMASVPTDFYSKNLSGVQRLENGNTLICEANKGRFFEIDTNQIIVWQYVNPVNSLGPINQDSAVSNNDVFRCEKYPLTFPGFKGKDLIPKGYIESGSTFVCDSFPEVQTAILDIKNVKPVISPNPAKEMVRLSVSGEHESDFFIDIYNANGQHLMNTVFPRGGSEMEINLKPFNNGLYLIVVHSNTESWTEKMLISK